MGISVPGYPSAGMRYKVIRTCYWQRRLWEKGEKVELEGNVPEHFKPLYDLDGRLSLNKNTEEPSDEVSGDMENLDIMPSSLEDMNVG